MKAVALIVTTRRWFPTARLAMRLARAGFAVDAVCPSGHPLELTASLHHSFHYNGLAPLRSIRSALRASSPDIVIPGDDLATQHLHALHNACSQVVGTDASICRLIERSLGKVESFTTVSSRGRFMEEAQIEGVRVPKTEVISNPGELEQFISRWGLPVVLKADGSTGGIGVRIAKTRQEAHSGFRSLAKPPLCLRAVKRALIDHDLTLIPPLLSRQVPKIIAQTLIAGRDTTSTLACRSGKVLAALHFDVIQTAQTNGHATVLRLTDDEEMSAATEKMVWRLQLSGLHGFDFVREMQTRNAYLIEINPRTTQVCHLPLGRGRDLCAALHAAVTGEHHPGLLPVTNNATIALFPHEWRRDPGSPYLRSAFHDVPWEAPELVLACLRGRRRQSATRPSKVARENSLDLALLGSTRKSCSS